MPRESFHYVGWLTLFNIVHGIRLFKKLYVTLSFARSGGSCRAARKRIQIYRERVVQCLTLADYTKCGPYTIETMICYLSIEYAQVADNQTGLWLLLGTIIRLAVRMGYHREASTSSYLSPFQAEMRRRNWAALFMLDSAAADQYGLPRMVNEALVDARPPANLLDEDLGPDMKTLPRSRPEHETTLVGFLAIKNRLLSTRNIITDLTSYPNKPVSYKEILKLDKIIKEQFQNIPGPLKMRPMSKSLTDSSGVIANRIFLALVGYKSRCMLHQHYLLPARTDDRYRYSRKACIESALELLRIQESIREECQIGRRLSHEHWKFETSVKHVFYLACTILCVDLNYDLSEAPSRRRLGKETLLKIVKALQGCYNIWVESTDASRESQKAVAMLRFILEKAQRSGRLNQLSTNTARFDSDGIAIPTHMTDPSLFNHDSGSMSWENHDVDMSQFDLGQFDAMLNGMQENSQINLNNWDVDASAIMNQPLMNSPDWWTTFDPSVMNG
uniref:Putative transcriptional regulatory protein C1F7.11c n=1 Tax=Talaromyces marneffei PM1 TaxID=1077442 RepID=A0A093UZW0_TALMA